MEIKLDDTGLKSRIKRLKNYINEQYPTEAAEIYKDKIANKAPVDSGKLRSSFYVSDDKILSSVGYAAIQNEGGRVRITERMRGKMWSLYYKTGKEVYKNIAITNKSHIKIPGKNYIDRVGKLSKDLQRQLQLKINKIWL